MKIRIGAYNAQKRAVSVSFSHEGVSHKRDVNACHDEAGDYDPKATKGRVAEVALGVEAKIASGAIGNAPP